MRQLVSLATVNAPARSNGDVPSLGDAVAAIERDGQAEVELAARSDRIRREFLDDSTRQRLDDAIASMRKPLLIFDDPNDEIVGIDNAAQIFAVTITGSHHRPRPGTYEAGSAPLRYMRSAAPPAGPPPVTAIVEFRGPSNG